jgi:putative ABC transport system permease protein
VLIAFLLCAPLSWWLLDWYLEETYEYRVDVPWWALPVTGVIALTFALLIVATQAFRAATANPVNSLRNE